jgi:hypothetical protein
MHAIGSQTLFDQRLCGVVIRICPWQEAHTNGEIRDGIRNAPLCKFTCEKRPWNLRQNTGTIATFAISSNSTTMGHIPNRLDRQGEDFVAWLARPTSNKADPARIMLVAWVVQTTPRHLFRHVGRSSPVCRASYNRSL